MHDLKGLFTVSMYSLYIYSNLICLFSSPMQKVFPVLEAEQALEGVTALWGFLNIFVFE